MIAADRALWRERFDALGRFWSVGNILLAGGVAMAIVSGFSYYRGKSTAEAMGLLAANAVIRKSLADSSKAIEQRIDARYQSIAFAERASANARAIHQTARAKITLVSDTVVRIDSVLVDVPREIVREIAASDTLIAKQDVQLTLLTAQLRDLTADRDVWRHRALLDEEQIKRARPSRFGFRTGAAVGIITVVAIAAATR